MEKSLQLISKQLNVIFLCNFCMLRFLHLYYTVLFLNNNKKMRFLSKYGQKEELQNMICFKILER